jgi:hypothetical protein
MERAAPFPETMVYSFIHISDSLVKELLHETRGKYIVTVRRAP